MSDSCDNNDQNWNKNTKARATKQKTNLQTSKKKHNTRQENGLKIQQKQAGCLRLRGDMATHMSV